MLHICKHLCNQALSAHLYVGKLKFLLLDYILGITYLDMQTATATRFTKQVIWQFLYCSQLGTKSQMGSQAVGTCDCNPHLFTFSLHNESKEFGQLSVQYGMREFNELAPRACLRANQRNYFYIVVPWPTYFTRYLNSRDLFVFIKNCFASKKKSLSAN